MPAPAVPQVHTASQTGEQVPRREGLGSQERPRGRRESPKRQREGPDSLFSSTCLEAIYSEHPYKLGL